MTNHIDIKADLFVMFSRLLLILDVVVECTEKIQASDWLMVLLSYDSNRKEAEE